MAKKRLVIGNWKMYVEDLEEAKAATRILKRKIGRLPGVEIGIAPPAPFIEPLASLLESSPVRVGAQDVSSLQGAYTGQISASMARSAGADFALVGHSERRAMGQSNEDVKQSLVAAASAGLAPILCVGERERSEDGGHISIVEGQLRDALRGAQSLTGKLMVAYEPVWAIGKSATDAMKPGDVREMAIFIRKTLADILGRKDALRVPVLYGGSVEPENALALITEGDVAGFLVGHASVEPESFIAIAEACKK